MTIFYWPDGTLCYPKELDEYIGRISDDFKFIRVNADYDNNDIDWIVRERIIK